VLGPHVWRDFGAGLAPAVVGTSSRVCLRWEGERRGAGHVGAGRNSAVVFRAVHCHKRKMDRRSVADGERIRRDFSRMGGRED
jgi:hypothetical protein